MKTYRLLSCTLYLFGVASFVFALESPGSAQSCSEVEYTSAGCISAHVEGPVENGSGSYCEWSMNVCQKTAATSCVDRWGLAYSGKCFHEILGTTETHTCYQDTATTLVSLHWYTAKCKQDNAECNCDWDETSMTELVHLCECTDVTN